MPTHWSLAALVKLSDAGTDMQSPSKFVQRAKKVEHVEDAFRTAGRFDAVVWIHPGHDDDHDHDHDHDDDHDDDAYRDALAAFNEIRALPGVADAEALVWRPSSEQSSAGAP